MFSVCVCMCVCVCVCERERERERKLNVHCIALYRQSGRALKYFEVNLVNFQIKEI